PALTDSGRILSYYNVSLGYNLLPGEAFIGRNWAFRTALYVIAGAGSTTFAGDDRFTINFGAGYRFLATDWLALHVDVRDHIFDIDVLGYSKTAHNLETTAGLSVFF
ncbi:MAG TPA: outer membrane beta-barrel domain-containing protein, partial [Gammaproteobacteria bacterium]|nr:outer membrane beta-barrel domain-containing protein [Gammaproteobacteria bacterium]